MIVAGLGAAGRTSANRVTQGTGYAEPYMRYWFLLPAAASLLSAQSELWPGARYDPAIPTPKTVHGYDFGERVSSHANIMKYMEALAAAAPARMKIVEYARSYEGRKLVSAIIGSEANIRRLPEIQTSMKRLRDPRKTDATEAGRLSANLPAVIMLSYGVHGNEISSPDAALATAYHLLAARSDALVNGVLANVVVMIDPTQNPDGRDRFVHNYEISAGPEPDGSPAAAERNEPWPAGRTNHYHFDLNRDWTALTQPETRGRIKLLLDWLPLVFVDLHEMSTDSTYYFAPEAVPYNPHLAEFQRKSLDWFGRNNAKWFDQFGFSYFTREVYDAFYPGYGASWPSYYGGIAMTYENASVRGLLAERTDETLYTFRQSVQKHFVASLATAETAAARRAELLANFYKYQQTAVEEGGREETREYILPRRGDASRTDRLALLLAEQGVEVRRATTPLRAAGVEYPAGSYAVALAQPAKRLIRNLLDPRVDMEAEFLKEQERRRKRKLQDEIYDVTAWSLPLQFNVECVGLKQAAEAAFEPLAAGTAMPGKVTGESTDTLAYLIPWGTNAAGRFLARALRTGLRVHSSDKPIVQSGRTYPPGTLIVKVKENGTGAGARVAAAAAASGADVTATSTGWVDEGGVNFGSSNVQWVRPPRIAMAWDAPIASGSAGHTRHVLERQFGYPVTPIRIRQMSTVDLRKFHVLILPEGSANSYSEALGANGLRRLKEWVSAGGVVVGLGGAVSFLSDTRTGLLAIQQENRVREGERPATPAAPQTEQRATGRNIEKQEQFDQAIQANSELPDDVAGVLVRARVDGEHWMGHGASEVNVLLSGRAIFTPIKLDKGNNVAVFEAPEKLLVSGYLWDENRRQLAFKPFVVTQREGRGWVIGFTADPNYRGYMDGLNVLFLNAVFRGPAHTRGGGSPSEEEQAHAK